MDILMALRKIRACEGEVSAQLVFEYAIKEAVEAEREACAKRLNDRAAELRAKAFPHMHEEKAQTLDYAADLVRSNTIAHRPVEAEGWNGSGGATGCAAKGSEVGAGDTAAESVPARDIHSELTLAAFHREVAK